MPGFVIKVLVLLLATPCVSSYALAASDHSAATLTTELAARGGHRRAAARRTKKVTRIVLDAGHGGEDYGTHSLTKPRIHEKYLSLSATRMVRDYLKKMGYRTIMTRSKDEFISLKNRVAFASKNNATFFVSIHFNSAPNTQAHGIEVFYYSPQKASARTRESAKLAEALLARTVKNTQAKIRGVKHGNFAVIRDTSMPAVLIEGGFLTNTDELQNLKNPAYINRYAKGIAQGIDDYVQRR